MAERTKTLSLTAARLVLGTVSLVHGLANTFGWFGGLGADRFAGEVAPHVPLAPSLIAWLVAIFEVLGGALLILGIWARPVAFVLLILVAAILLFGRYYRAFFVERDGCEYMLALMALCSITAAHGPGAYYVELRSGDKK